MKFPVLFCVTYKTEQTRFMPASNEVEYQALLERILDDDSTTAYSVYEFSSLHTRVTRWEQTE